MFELDHRLANDTVLVGNLPLSRVLLMNDQQYPWVILVPRRENIREIFQLSLADQQQLSRESSELSAWMSSHFSAEKMNVAALGNLVPQLHIHHIARFTGDPAWPKPVWGVLPAHNYSVEKCNVLVKAIREGLSLTAE